MKNIVLIGMMGCGKSTVGALLAEALGRELVDTDALIEGREDRSVAEIFAAEGEPYFRTRELEISRELAAREGLVIACGGGLPMGEGCMEALASGTVFWLDRDPGETYGTLDTGHRPLAQGGREDFLARHALRAPTYRRWAHHVISGAPSAHHAARAILSILQREENTP